MIQHFEAAENPNKALNVSFVNAIKTLVQSPENPAEAREAHSKYFSFFCLWYFKAATCTDFSDRKNRISHVPKAHTIGFSAMSITTGTAS